LAEDGGVSDNLPIRLAASFDKLDLLFILPLNSSFNIDDPPSFLGTRLTRAMDVRQGMLERMALKHVYLFNMQYVLSRSRPPIPAFVIAPGQPLHVQTTELWRRPELRRAVFQQMYAATSQALENFFAPGRLYASCDAFRPMWQRQRYAPIAEAGYLRESIVDPGWEPGNAFDEEMRF
jgi:predicted acylesterase/phospholipase RssA